jgi:hypothetical protein
MGNEREYNSSGGFSEHLYDDHPDYVPFYHNGLKAKVIMLKADPDGNHAGLPPFADTSDIYLRVGKSGNVIQAKVYVDRKHSLDFDWGHEHRNKGAGSNSQVFPKGVVHVQKYSQTNQRISNQARYMTDAEIEKYGAILKHFDPKVKFRP